MNNFTNQYLAVKYCNVVPSRADKAFYALMQIKKKASLQAFGIVGNLSILKEEDFEHFYFKHKVDKYDVFTISGEKTLYVPSELINDDSEGWSLFEKRVAAFVTMVHKYGFVAAVKSLN